MDKLGINIVGPSDHLTRLYNVGKGFCGITGYISMAAASSLYLLFTADRRYEVTVDGALVVTPEPTENGVTPFNVDWSESSRRRARKSGTLTITNPDVPGEVSTFQVTSGEPGVMLSFGKDSGVNSRVVLDMNTDVGKLDREMRALLESGADIERERSGRTFFPNGFETYGGDDLASLRRNILT